MGLFRRASESRPSTAAARASGAVEHPLHFDDERDLPRFEQLIDGFIMTMGTPRWDGVVQAIAREGGVDVDRIERGMSQHGGDVTSRPWRWLLLGTLAANRAGKHALVLKACGVVSLWQVGVAPKLTLRDFFEVGLAGCPSDIEREIYACGTDPAVAISVADDDIVVTDPEGVTVLVGAIRDTMRGRLRELDG